MLIEGLAGAPQFNGTKGKISHFDKEKERWIVQTVLDSKDNKLRDDYLTLVVDEAPEDEEEDDKQKRVAG